MGIFDQTDMLFQYKAGQGLSDFTFSRASAATYRKRDGSLSTASSTGVTRLEWYDVDGDDGWEQPALLLEVARTNSFLRSKEFDNAYWTKNGTTVTANAAVAPDDSTTADRIVEDGSTNVVHQLSRAISSTAITDNTLQSFSVFAKPDQQKWLRLAINDKSNTTTHSYFNLETATAGTTSTAHTTAIEKWQDGWCRAMVMLDGSSGTTDVTCRFAPASTDNVTAYDGSTTDGLYLWGAQFEIDGGYPTSYIPTSTVAVSRSADSLTHPIRFGVGDVTVYAKVIRPEHADLSTGADRGADEYFVDIATTNPRINIYWQDTARQAIASIINTATAFVARDIPAGNTIEVCAQYKNLTSDPQVRADVGSGFSSWSSTGSVTPFFSFGSTTLTLSKSAFVDVKIARGQKTLAAMRALR